MQRREAREKIVAVTPSSFNNDWSLTQFSARPLEFLSCRKGSRTWKARREVWYEVTPPSFINRLWFTTTLAADMFPFKMSSRAPARFNCKRVRRVIYGCSVMASFPIRLVTNPQLPFSMYSKRNAIRERPVRSKARINRVDSLFRVSVSRFFRLCAFFVFSLLFFSSRCTIDGPW